MLSIFLLFDEPFHFFHGISHCLSYLLFKYKNSLPFLFQSVKRYVDRISKYQILNQQIFEVLNKTLVMGDSQAPSCAPEVNFYQPPIHQSQVKNM